MTNIDHFERIDGIGADPARTREVVEFVFRSIEPELEDATDQITRTMHYMEADKHITLIGRTAEDQILSTASTGLVNFEGLIYADIYNVAVDSNNRGRQLGRHTVEAIEGLIIPKGALWAQLASEEGSDGFWERMGYFQVQYVQDEASGKWQSLRAKKFPAYF